MPHGLTGSSDLKGRGAVWRLSSASLHSLIRAGERYGSSALVLSQAFENLAKDRINQGSSGTLSGSGGYWRRENKAIAPTAQISLRAKGTGNSANEDTHAENALAPTGLSEWRVIRPQHFGPDDNSITATRSNVQCSCCDHEFSHNYTVNGSV